jgi:hypothetical protein
MFYSLEIIYTFLLPKTGLFGSVGLTFENARSGYIVKCVHFIVEFNENPKRNACVREPVIKILKCKMQWN